MDEHVVLSSFWVTNRVRRMVEESEGRGRHHGTPSVSFGGVLALAQPDLDQSEATISCCVQNGP